MALDQHLGNRSGAAEVTVYLERRMGIEHIRIRSLRTQQETEDAERMVAIPKPRPEIDAPRRGPSRSLIAADLEQR